MKKAWQWLTWIQPKLRQWLRNGKVRVVLAFVLVCLIVRGLPYLAPIHAQDLLQDRLAVEFSDRNGLSLGTLLTRDREHTAVVPLDRVSPNFIQAILAAEDGRFYQHGALDLKAIARSIKEAIQAKRIVSGASTITMQLARMLDTSPRTLSGKLREIWLSWRLAAGMTKDEILSAYINRLPMGGNIYGTEAAAQIYFATSAAELNLAQASLLAAIPNNPTYFNPYEHWQRLKRRQAYVLDRMVQEGYITRTQRERAYAEEIALLPRHQGIIAAPHFLFWLGNQLPKQHPSQIRTTIDRPLQQFVEAQVQQVIRTLTPNNVHQAAALVIDNHTGEVLAYVGSTDYFNEAQLGRNDGVQARRQPGSTLKPFLYELALENRTIHPNTILADVPTHYAIPGAKLYSPTDYNETFLGPVRVRVALANSLNVPAVRVLERVGVQTFLNRLQQLGFGHLTKPPEYYGLGLALGSGEVNLWELTRAYVTLARQGQATPLVTTANFPLSYSISVNDSLVKRNYRDTEFAEETIRGNREIKEVLDSDLRSRGGKRNAAWALITDMLSDAHARATAFGVDSVLSLPFSAAVKTGTSSDFRDTWTVGFTSDYTVATWVGNFTGDRMRQVSGVTGAAPLWNRIMLHLHSSVEPAAFSPPSGLVQRPICALSGMRPTPACPSIVQEYFYPEDLTDYERQSDTFYQIASAASDNSAHSPSHQSPSYRLNLPPEYDEWVSMQRSPTVVSGRLKILFPRNGDVFLLNAAASSPSPSDKNSVLKSAEDERAKLEFKLAGVLDEPVEWWLNGQKLTTNSSPFLFWSLTPGNWRLEVKKGEMFDTVNFQVQVSNSRSTHRGFSIANPAKRL